MIEVEDLIMRATLFRTRPPIPARRPIYNWSLAGIPGVSMWITPRWCPSVLCCRGTLSSFFVGAAKRLVLRDATWVGSAATASRSCRGLNG